MKINDHFNPNRSCAEIRFPRLTVGRLERLEIVDGDENRSLFLAFDLVESQWLKLTEDDDCVINETITCDARSFWCKANEVLIKPDHGHKNPFLKASLYRFEVVLSEKEAVTLLGAQFQCDSYEREIDNIESQWFELWFYRDRPNEGSRFGHLFHNLFADATEAYFEVRRVGGRKAESLSEFFSVEKIPGIEERRLAERLRHVQAKYLAVHDVGQGNANSLLGGCNFIGLFAELYFDLGCGVYGNKSGNPLKLCLDLSHQPTILLSHWDSDHWSGAYKITENDSFPALRQCWVAPKQKITPHHLVFAADVINNGGRFYILCGNPGDIKSFRASLGKQLTITFGSGGGRNASGLVLSVRKKLLCTTGWLLTGDCDYVYINGVQNMSTFGAIVVPHHGAKLVCCKSIPKPPESKYHRLIYSFGHGNSSGPTRVRHPTSFSVQAHISVGWNHSNWDDTNPGIGELTTSVRATADHIKANQGSILVGWNKAPKLGCFLSSSLKKVDRYNKWQT